MGLMSSTLQQVIAQVKSDDPSLTEIELHSFLSEHSMPDFIHLCQALHLSTYVQKMVVHINKLHQFAPDAVGPLADMLRGNSSITELELQEWPLHTHNAELLASGLRQHPMLRSLSIDGAKDTDLRPILTALVSCPALERLKLYFCEALSNAGAELAALIRCSSSLTELSVSSCNISDWPLRLLLNELEISMRLHTLILWFHHLTDADALRIGAMLRVNRSLRTLDLSFNDGIDEGGWRAIADAMDSNTTLRRLDTHGCDVPAAAREQIDAALMRNGQLQLARIPAPTSVAEQWALHGIQPGVPVSVSAVGAALLDSSSSGSSSNGSGSTSSSSSAPTHAAAASESASSSRGVDQDHLRDSSESDPEVTLPQPTDPAALTPPDEYTQPGVPAEVDTYTQPGVPSEADMRTEPGVPLQSESLNDDDDSVTLPAVPTTEQLAAMLSTHAAISVASPAAVAVSPPAPTATAAAATPAGDASKFCALTPVSPSDHIPSSPTVGGLAGWGAAAVSAWLTSLGRAYSTYASAWYRDGITGGYLSRLRLLPCERRDAKLRDLLGVASPLHRDVILDALDAM